MVWVKTKWVGGVLLMACLCGMRLGAATPTPNPAPVYGLKSVNLEVKSVGAPAKAKGAAVKRSRMKVKAALAAKESAKNKK